MRVIMAIFSCVLPQNDPLSNYRMVWNALLSRAPIPLENVHPIPTEGLTPAESARRYEVELRRYYGSEELDLAGPLFDVTFLGLGLLTAALVLRFGRGDSVLLSQSLPLLEHAERRPAPRLLAQKPKPKLPRIYQLSGRPALAAVT